MELKFYKFIPKGNDKAGGVFYDPSDWPYQIARAGEEVYYWKSLIVWQWLFFCL